MFKDNYGREDRNLPESTKYGYQLITQRGYLLICHFFLIYLMNHSYLNALIPLSVGIQAQRITRNAMLRPGWQMKLSMTARSRLPKL